MTKLKLDVNSNFVVEVEAQESDKRTELIHIKFFRHYLSETVLGTDELFLTPDQTEELGKFLLSRSDQIRELQRSRKL